MSRKKTAPPETPASSALTVAGDAESDLLASASALAARAQEAKNEAHALTTQREALIAEGKAQAMEQAKSDLREEFRKKLAAHEASTVARLGMYETRNLQLEQKQAQRVGDGLELVQQMPLPPDLDALGPLPEPILRFFGTYKAFLATKRIAYSDAKGSIAPHPLDLSREDY